MDDKRLLAIIATRPAQVLENSRLYEEEKSLLIIQEEIQLAAKIQQEKETSKHPENAEAWFMLGRVNIEQKNYKEMLAAFNASLKVSNQYQKDISNFKLSAWGTNVNKGVDFYNKGIQNPDSSGTYFVEAIGYLQTAIMLVPDSA